VNAALYAPPAPAPGKAGRPRKYGGHSGNAAEMAATLRTRAKAYALKHFGARREALGAERLVMLNTLRCPVRLVWAYRKTHWLALLSTSLAPTVKQIVHYYSARWRIEAGYREIKQEIGRAYTQTRNPDAVTNLLHSCIVATAITWLYAAHLNQAPIRRYASERKTEFAFADVRRPRARLLREEGSGIDRAGIANPRRYF
jgi:hypothetical protein